METIEGKKYNWKFEEAHGQLENIYCAEIGKGSARRTLLLESDDDIKRPVVFTNINDINSFMEDISITDPINNVEYEISPYAISFFDRGAWKYISREEK